jgi:hypothetical protein
MTVSAWQHWLGGTVGGALGVVASHPLDTVKTLVQCDAQSARAGMIKTGAALIRRAGVRALYSGIGAPLVGLPAIKAVLFGCNGQAAAGVRWVQGRPDGSSLSWAELCLTSTIGGAGACLVATPVERVRTKALPLCCDPMHCLSS